MAVKVSLLKHLAESASERSQEAWTGTQEKMSVYPKSVNIIFLFRE